MERFLCWCVLCELIIFYKIRESCCITVPVPLPVRYSQTSKTWCNTIWPFAGVWSLCVYFRPNNAASQRGSGFWAAAGCTMAATVSVRCVFLRLQVHTHAHTHTHIHKYMHTLTNTYTHTHMPSPAGSSDDFYTNLRQEQPRKFLHKGVHSRHGGPVSCHSYEVRACGRVLTWDKCVVVSIFGGCTDFALSCVPELGRWRFYRSYDTCAFVCLPWRTKIWAWRGYNNSLAR